MPWCRHYLKCYGRSSHRSLPAVKCNQGYKQRHSTFYPPLTPTPRHEALAHCTCRRRHDGGKGFKPLLLYDAAQRQLSPHQSTYWANFYKEHRRDPSNVEPAPWVKARMSDLAWK